MDSAGSGGRRGLQDAAPPERGADGRPPSRSAVHRGRRRNDDAARRRGRLRRGRRLNDAVSVTFPRDAGHILGSAMIELTVPRSRKRHDGSSSPATSANGTSQSSTIPTAVTEADYVVMESTYGDRDHENQGEVDDATGSRRSRHRRPRRQRHHPHLRDRAGPGVDLSPEPARARQDASPTLPVFLDSPMAADVNEVFRRHRECFDAEAGT